MKRILPFCLAACLALPGLAAAPLPTEQIRSSEQRQQQISSEARQMIGALDAMLGEYERNHLGGEDVAMVRKLRGSLDQLTAAEMRQVVDLLQQARAVRDPGTAVKTVADAYSAQKQVISSINRILLAHTRSEQARDLARQIDELADRQSRNLQNGIELGRMSAGSKPENFAAVMQAQLETQRGEQAALVEDLKAVRERMEKFATDPTQTDLARGGADAVNQLKMIEPSAGNAAEALKAGQLFKAVTDEKSSRDELRKLARQLAPRERGPEALRQAEREVARMMREQEELSGETGQQKAEVDFEKWIADKIAEIDPNKTLAGEFRRLTPEERKQSAKLRGNFEAEQRAKATQLAKLEDRQGELATEVDAMGYDLPEAEQAAQALRAAATGMQEARSAMLEANAPDAQKQQEQALDALRKAHAELRKKAEDAELLAGASGDKVKDLEWLHQAAQEMAAQEQALAAKPDAAQQAAIARRAEAMARRATDLAPKAETAMQAATANARRSEEEQRANRPQQARQEAQHAARNFEQAAEQIALALERAKGAQQQAQQVAQAMTELGKIIAAEQKIILETAKAEGSAQQKHAANFRAIAPQQERAQQMVEALRGTLTANLLSASQALADAGIDMGAARAQLEAEAGPAAQEAENQALEKLFAAQRSMAQLLAQLQQQAGMEMTPEQLAQAAAQLAEALQQLQNGQANLQQAAGQMGQPAAQNAAQAAQQAAQAAQQAAQSAQAAQQQAQQARNPTASTQAAQAAQQATQAAQNAQRAAQAAQQMANQNGPQAAQQAAQQAGQAAVAAQQAAQAAQNAQQAAQQGMPNASPLQQAANQQAAQQAGQAAASAQQAAQAARQAQQMAGQAAQAAQQGAQQAAQSMQQAGQQLSQAAMQAAQAAGAQMCPSAQQATQQAARQLAQAAAQAMNGQNSAAQQTAQQAAQQLAQASGMNASQQAGVVQQMPGQPMPAMPGMPGAGQQGGKGSGKKQQAMNQPSPGAEGYQAGDPEAVQRASRQAALKAGGFLGLPPRERAALQQSLGEKYPEEYGAMVEQYLLNLSKEAARK